MATFVDGHFCLSATEPSEARREGGNKLAGCQLVDWLLPCREDDCRPPNSFTSITICSQDNLSSGPQTSRLHVG